MGDNSPVGKQVSSLIVFDFDMTISSVHAFRQLAGYDNEKHQQIVTAPFAATEAGQLRKLNEMHDSELQKFMKAICGSKSRIEMLASFLHYLTDVCGCTLVIGTRGNINVVSALLERAGLRPFFTEVAGKAGLDYSAISEYDRMANDLDSIRPSSRSRKWNSKGVLMKGLLLKYPKGKFSVFVDDDEREVNSVKTSITTTPVFTHHVKGDGGLQESDMKEIAQYVHSKIPTVKEWLPSDKKPATNCKP